MYQVLEGTGSIDHQHQVLTIIINGGVVGWWGGGVVTVARREM